MKHHLATKNELISRLQLLLHLFYEASEGHLVPLNLIYNSGVLHVEMTTIIDI